MSDIGRTYDKSSSWQKYQWRRLLKLATGFDCHDINSALDLGCGTGNQTSSLFESFSTLEKITAIDSEASMLRYARRFHSMGRRVKYLLLPIEKVGSLKPSRFDLVVANYSLHWIKDKERLFKSLQQLTQSGSLLLIGTCTKLPRALAAIDKYVRRKQGIGRSLSPFFYLSKKEWVRILKTNGWNIQRILISRDQHLVKAEDNFFRQWNAASAGKAFYGLPKSDIEKMIPDLMETLNKSYLQKKKSWRYFEDTLLIVAERK